MTPEDFAAIRRWSAGRIKARTPQRIVLDGIAKPSVSTSAVYAAYSTDGTCLYVGSVCRPEATCAAGQRLAEHDASYPRWSTWAVLYVVVIDSNATPAEVRSIEGYMGLILRPVQNSRLPLARTLAPILENRLRIPGSAPPTSGARGMP